MCNIKLDKNIRDTFKLESVQLQPWLICQASGNSDIPTQSLQKEQQWNDKLIFMTNTPKWLLVVEFNVVSLDVFWKTSREEVSVNHFWIIHVCGEPKGSQQNSYAYANVGAWKVIMRWATLIGRNGAPFWNPAFLIHTRRQKKHLGWTMHIVIPLKPRRYWFHCQI